MYSNVCKSRLVEGQDHAQPALDHALILYALPDDPDPTTGPLEISDTCQGSKEAGGKGRNGGIRVQNRIRTPHAPPRVQYNTQAVPAGAVRWGRCEPEYYIPLMRAMGRTRVRLRAKVWRSTRSRRP